MCLCFAVTGFGLWRRSKGKLGTLETQPGVGGDDDAEVELMSRSDHSHLPSLETETKEGDMLVEVQLTPPNTP